MLLTKFASRVTILVRDGAFKATRFIVDKVLANDRIDIRWRTQVYEFFGSRGKLDKIAIFNNQTDAQEEMALDGAFIFIGLSLNSGFLKNSDIQIDPWGFVVTGQSLMRAGQRPDAFTDRDPFLLETSIPGIFAAGDVRDASTKQVVSTAGEGGTAALEIREFLKRT